MSHFYGKLTGSRGVTTRCGTKNSGIVAVAASWKGAVRTELFVQDGEDWAVVSLMPWQGVGVSRVVYRGPVDLEVPEPNTNDVARGAVMQLLSGGS